MQAMSDPKATEWIGMGGPTAGGGADEALGSLDLRPSWPAMNGSRMNMFTPPRAGIRDFALWACAHSRISADWYDILYGFRGAVCQRGNIGLARL